MGSGAGCGKPGHQLRSVLGDEGGRAQEHMELRMLNGLVRQHVQDEVKKATGRARGEQCKREAALLENKVCELRAEFRAGIAKGSAGPDTLVAVRSTVTRIGHMVRREGVPPGYVGDVLRVEIRGCAARSLQS